MNYTQKTFEEIFEPILEDAVEQGLISHAEDFPDLIANREDISNYYIMEESVIANLVASIIYPDLTSVYESGKVEYAEGVDLDDLGVERGIPRPLASYASAEVTFTRNGVAEEDITIDEGVIIATESGIAYRTVEQIYIPLESESVTVQCLSVEPGSENKVLENTLTNIVSVITHDLSCTNESASSGGEDEYTDDEYRYLILNWIKIHLKGSNEAYENYFANFDGLDDYKLVPKWNGSGTMKIILDPGTPYLLNKAYEEIQESVCQADEDLFMTAPTLKPVDIYAVVNVDIDQINPYSDLEKSDIQSKVISSIKTYVDGGYLSSGEYYQGLRIGEDFIPHKLAVFLDKEILELKNITFNYPDDYIEVLDDEQCVANNITIEMM